MTREKNKRKEQEKPLETIDMRGYTTLANTVRAFRKTRKLRDGGGLEEFLFRGQVMQVYRDMMREVYLIKDSQVRNEVRRYVKDEYRSTSHVSDLETRRSLLIGGIRNWRSVANNLGLSRTGGGVAIRDGMDRDKNV